MAIGKLVGLASAALMISGCQSWQYRDIDSLPAPAALPDTSQPGVVQDSTITLSWTAPLTRRDGSSLALSEIQYYLIEYGQNPDQLDQVQRVDGSTNTYELQGLTPGTWYFTIKAIDNDGLTSQSSEPVSHVVD